MKLARHQRLTAIYTMLERVQQAELRLAQTALAQVVAQTETMGGELRAAAAMQRKGTGADQAAAATTHGYARAVLVNLAVAQHEAASAQVAAEAAYAESRLQLEQMKAIEAGAQRSEKVKQERRVQMAADDRFGARRWAEAKKQR